MLKNEFSPYYIAGVRLSWNFGSLYTLKNDRKVIENKRRQLDNNRDVFLFNTRLEMTQQDQAIQSLEKQMQDDDEIIRLRTNIRKSAEAKVANGTLTVTEMLRELTNESLARQSKRMTKIGMYGVALIMLAACGKGIPGYDATGTFEATEVIVSAEAAGKLLRLEVEEGTRLKAGEEIGLVDTVQLYLKKLQLEASMKSVESQRPDLAKQIAATKQQIATAEREKKRVENLLAAGAANQKQLDDWDAQVKLLERQLVAQESSLQNSTNSLMLSFSVSGNAMNFSTCIFSDSPCQLSELSSDSNQRSSVDGQSVSYDSVRSLSVSDVELGLKLVTESNSNNYRLRRIIEINDSLKDVMQKFLVLRENSLVLDQSKSFYSDKDPHYSITCSDYYVFALRRILI